MAWFENTRREFVRAASTIPLAGLAGCIGGEAPTPTATQPPADEEELPPGVSREEFETGPVPEAYRTASSQAGEARDPGALVAKESVKFQEAADAVAAGLTESGRTCENCAEFIPDKNGDGFGACAKVEGYIGAEDWCALWESIEEAEGGE